MNKSEMHNEMAKKFVLEIVAPMAHANASHGEMMVLFESIIYGMLELNSTLYKIKPEHSVVFIEEALHQAITRYTGAER